MPVVPVDVAVILIELLFPVVSKLAVDANPTLPAAEAVIDVGLDVATAPLVVKLLVKFTPLPPALPPVQVENVTFPPPEKRDEKKRP